MDIKNVKKFFSEFKIVYGLLFKGISLFFDFDGYIVIKELIFIIERWV